MAGRKAGGKGPTIVRGRAFGDERVPADGREFHDCTFDGTTLVYRGGDPFMLFGTDIAKVQLAFEGSAASTLNTLRTLYAFGGHEFVEQIIASIRNPFDQTVN